MSFSDVMGDTVRRAVFNQLWCEISSGLYLTSILGATTWYSGSDYTAEATVQAGGDLWNALIPSGPNSAIGAVNPEASGQTAWQLIRGPETVPSQITSIAADAGNGRVRFVWHCPLNGGQVVTSFRIEWRLLSESYEASRQADLTNPAYLLTGLMNNQDYFVRIRATNAVGPGVWSEDVVVRPVPSAPSDLEGLLIVLGNTELTARWFAPEDNGSAILSYQLQWKSGTQMYDASREAIVSGTEYELSGLTNGLQYDVRVRARSAAGPSGWVESSGIPRGTVPGIISTLSASPGDATLSLTWDAPDTGGSSILDYLVQWRRDNQAYSSSRQAVVSGGATSRTIAGLTNDLLHHVRVRARNVYGNGNYAATSGIPVVAVAAPSQVALPMLTPGNGQLEVTWPAPQDGGSPILGYRVQWRGPGQSFSTARQANVTLSEYIITGLQNTTTYGVRVLARNAVDDGPWSDEATGIPVAGRPDRVTGLTLSSRSVSIIADWDAPADNGSSITRYELQWKSGVQAYDSVSRQVDVTSGTDHTIINLTNYTEYDIRVRAVNSVGPGDWSEELSETPLPGSVTFNTSGTFLWPWPTDRGQATIRGGEGGGGGGGGGGQAGETSDTSLASVDGGGGGSGSPPGAAGSSGAQGIGQAGAGGGGGGAGGGGGDTVVTVGGQSYTTDGGEGGEGGEGGSGGAGNDGTTEGAPGAGGSGFLGTTLSNGGGGDPADGPNEVHPGIDGSSGRQGELGQAQVFALQGLSSGIAISVTVGAGGAGGDGGDGGEGSSTNGSDGPDGDDGQVALTPIY